MVTERKRTVVNADALREVEEIHPQTAYLYEEQVGSPNNKPSSDDEIFVFQYWPETVSDTYTPNYNEVPIPGGSHPLFQYVGGGDRRITFTATFTSEVKDSTASREIVIGKDRYEVTGSKYTVDVAAALARLQRYLLPTYREGGQLGVVEAPPRLVLVLPGTNLGRDQDEVLVILRNAPVTYTHWYPDGTPRIATIDLEFSESVQSRQEGNRSRVKFISSARYKQVAKRYRLSAVSAPDTARGGH